jgi:hypothetical protein
MWQQPETVAVNAMQAGMKHGAGCITGGGLISAGICQDCGAEGDEALCRDYVDRFGLSNDAHYRPARVTLLDVGPTLSLTR